MPNRWWIYQRERFPVLAHGPLIAAFSLSAISYSSVARGQIALPAAAPALVSFFSAFFSFLQLRLADEFKDFDEDSRYRPYRPVPRGLVSLRELGWLWAATCAVQLALALWLKPALALLLGLAWTYLVLMSREFFVKEWLKRRPFTYMWTHMLIMPIVDFYTTACDWLLAGVPPPQGLIWFLLVSFFNGMVIEIGRKIRAPEDEEEGVETYSVLWGRRNAVLAWLAALAATAVFAWKAADRIAFAGPVLWVLGALLAGAVVLGASFLRRPAPTHGRRIEAMSGLWTIVMYLILGVVPLLYFLRVNA